MKRVWSSWRMYGYMYRDGGAKRRALVEPASNQISTSTILLTVLPCGLCVVCCVVCRAGPSRWTSTSPSRGSAASRQSYSRSDPSTAHTYTYTYIYTQHTHIFYIYIYIYIYIYNICIYIHANKQSIKPRNKPHIYIPITLTPPFACIYIRSVCLFTQILLCPRVSPSVCYR
jgi:hypothetical protein